MSYSFLRESKLYIVYGGNKYRIYTSSALTFNQTFAEESYSVKTLHDQSKMFEGSSITKANPASFSFDVPLTTEKDESIVLTLASDLSSNILNSFDMYVQTGSSTFKLEGAIITSASFDFIPQNQFTMRVEGEGTKLSRVGATSFTAGNFVVDTNYIITDEGNTSFTGIGAANNNIGTEFTATGVGSGTGIADYLPPGTTQSESATRTPLIVYPVVTLNDGSPKTMGNILSVNLNIQNEMEWTPYETLQDSLNSTTMFPSAHTVGKRIISGEIRQYQQDNNVAQFDDFSTDTSLTITAKNVSGDANFLEVAIDPVMYTARMQPEEVYTQSYDFRSLHNTTAVSTQITYS